MCCKLHILQIEPGANCTCCKWHMLQIACVANCTVCKLHVLQIACVVNCTCCKLHVLQIAHVANFKCCQECFDKVSNVFQRSLKSVSRKFPGRFKEVSGQFQGSFKEALFCNFVVALKRLHLTKQMEDMLKWDRCSFNWIPLIKTLWAQYFCLFPWMWGGTLKQRKPAANVILGQFSIKHDMAIFFLNSAVKYLLWDNLILQVSDSTHATSSKGTE